jgi:hypothetical protein
VGQELIALESNKMKKPCFWVREERQAKAEVDFILQHQSQVIPVEVKAGKTGTLRSLHQFIALSGKEYAVRLYSGPLSLEEIITTPGKKFKLLNLPYFLSSKIYEYIEALVTGELRIKHRHV